MAGLFDAVDKFARKEAPRTAEDDAKEVTEVEEAKKSSNAGAKNKKQMKKEKKKKKKAAAEPQTPAPADGLQTEIFVGNLPLETSTKDVARIFKHFGNVGSVRIRSVPAAGTAVDDAGNTALMKRVCAYKRKFSDHKDSVNAYVTFTDSGSVSQAAAAAAKSSVEANGMVHNGHTLRIDFAAPLATNEGSGLFDPKRSVFLGNLPLRVTEEQVRTHFTESLESGGGVDSSGGSVGSSRSKHSGNVKGSDDGPEGDDSPLVQGVRIVRDAETQLGKGFGYLLLRDRATAATALMLDGTKLAGRPVRVQVCGKQLEKGQHYSHYPKGPYTRRVSFHCTFQIQ